MASRVPGRCQKCGATDTDLIGIAQWTAPIEMGPVDLFCFDIFACYERAERDEI